MDWYSNARSVSTSYKMNVTNGTGSDSKLVCALYQVIETVKLKKVKDYVGGTLYVTQLMDEDGNLTYEFKNKQGQLILTQQIENNVRYDTYYVYDDYGNLCFVLPPLAADALTAINTTWSEETATIKSYAYIYRYDYKDRCTFKKLPGCEPIYYVYDKADRLIFTQNGEQRAKTAKEWTFNKYDALGRLIVSGIYKTNQSHDELIAKCKDIVVREKPGGAYEYTWNSLPEIPYSGTLLLNYYDNYYDYFNATWREALKFVKKGGFPDRYIHPSLGEGTPKGLLTGQRIMILRPDGTIGGETVSKMYYDNRGRLIQTRSSNHLGGIDEEHIAYNFTGQPVKKMHIHSATGKSTQTEVYAYAYDHAGRLLKTTHQLTDGTTVKPQVTLAENTYDELGRLKTNKKNNQANLSTTYTYNIRSWTKSISSPLFSQTLYYNESYGGSTKRYNGNISAMGWTVQGETTPRGYAFVYDNLSRLTAANYLVNGSANNNYKTSYSYDKHGNMKTLQCYGKTTASAFGLIDNLTMTYIGNQLTKAEDAIATITLAESTDFKNYSNTATEYTYNKNGAMTKDLNKGITQIQYNSLNLPQLMDIKSSVAEARNEYTYSAGGQKLKVVQKWNSSYSTAPVIGSAINTTTLNMTKTTDYVGNKIYENNVLKRILVDGGYYEGGVYYYYLNDHLGNNRVVANQSGTVIQKNHYYPFGMSFAETSLVEQQKQPYKYNGKELDQMHGLNLYDYSARYYESATGRFTTMDPLAEKYYSISPYAYVMNNPLKYIDPDGRTLRIAGNAKTIILDVARVAVTFRGSGIVNSLISSDKLYEINTVFLKGSSEFTMAPNFRDGFKYPIKYANDPWTTGENDIMYEGWEILGHEMQHGSDFEDGLIQFTSSMDSQLPFAEGRAVSFGNYLRESYGMNSFRSSYDGKTWSGDKSFRQFEVSSSDKVSNFKSLGGNKDGTSYGFSYIRANKNKYMVISYDKDKNLNINYYDNEDEYKKATENW